MKDCTRCKKNKDSNSFRVRYDKRINLKYLNNTCRECDSEISRERHNKLKHIPEYKRANCDRAKRYKKENPDLYREMQKIRRETPEYKKYRKNYIKKNKDKISDQEKICKRRYHEKNRDLLTDVYVVSKIIQKTNLSRNEIPIPLIKLKRLQIICIRSLKLKTK